MSAGIVFFKSFTLGVTIAATVGPIAILCISQTLLRGLKIGLSIGIGAATADGIYAVLAAYGVTTISHFIMDASQFLHILGGVILSYIGIRAFRLQANTGKPDIHFSSSFIKGYLKTLILTLTNPLTILLFIGVVCAIEDDTNHNAPLLITMGIFLGSLFWHLILVGISRVASNFLSTKHLNLINNASALILLGFGLYMFKESQVLLNLYTFVK